MSRQRILLFLLLVLIAALGYAWMTMPRQRRVTSAVVGSPVLPSGHQGQGGIADQIDELTISRSAEPFTPPLKNLFGSIFPDEKPVARKVAAKRPAVTVKPRIAPPRAEPLEVVVPPPVPRPEPLPPLTVMGFLRKGDAVTVFLAGRQGDIHLVGAGDSFSDGLIVREISPSAIVIARPRTGQTVSLPFGKAKTQRLPDSTFRSGRPDFEPPEETEAASGANSDSSPEPLQRQPAPRAPVIMKLQ